jgi:hypothetical protein
MRDYQKIVDDVRSSMYASGPEADATMRAAMEAYAEACRETNERLQKCGQLLKAGLRSEALQLCEIEPHLLDAVATLDFPERDTWIQIVARRGIAQPPPLSMEIAGDLNDAYAIEQPMEALLARHRLLALARSPLRYRVKTLRDLAEVDPDNPVWGEDLLLFERERCKEIQQEAMDAAAAGDVAAVAQLEAELQTSSWMETPSLGLVRLVSDAKAKLNTKQARKELQRIERELNDAFAEFDADRGRQLRKQWNHIAPLASLKDDDPLWQRVIPTLNWLQQEDQQEQLQADHAAAISSLEHDLDDEKPASVLERTYHAAVRNELGIPPILEQRYRTRISALQASAKRRTRLLLAGISAVALLIAGGAGWLFWSSMRAAEIARHASALQTLVDDQQTAEALKYAERLERDLPHVAAAPEIAEVMSAVNQSAKAERARKSVFTQATKQAAALVSQDLNDWTQVDQASDHLTAAAKHAKGENERLEVAQLQAQLGQHEERLRSAEMSSFSNDFRPLLERVRRLGDSGTLSPRERQQQVATLRSDAESLARRHPRINLFTGSQVKPLLTRLAAIEVDAQASLAMRERLQPITKAVGNSEGFAAVLETYSTEHPKEPRSGDLRRAKEEMPLWDSMLKFSNAAEQWAGRDIRRMTPEAATKMLEDIKQLVATAPRHPDAAAYREASPYLESVVRRTEATEALNKALRAPWIIDAPWVVRVKDGANYYMKARPVIDGSKLNKFVVNFALEERQKSFRPEDVERDGEAPHTILCAQLSDIINKPDTQTTWEEKFVYAVRAILADSQTDPVCRFELLKKTIDAGCRGSQCVDEAFAPQLRYLNSQRVNTQANWLDPDDREGQENRRNAITAMEDLPDVKIAERRLAELWNSVATPASKKYRWIGWLVRIDDQWQCQGPSISEARGSLVVVRQDAAKGAINVDIVAKCDASGVKIVSGAPREALVEGRPVFLVESK